MNDRLLYRIRNIGDRHATRKAVIGEAPLILEITDPSFTEFLVQIKVEDLTIPGHANMGTTQRFQAELPYIISGASKRWHLWEACVYRHRLVLHFANKQTKGGRSKAAALKCYFYMKLVLSDVQRYIGYLPRIEESYLKCLRLGAKPELEMVAGTGSFKAAYNLAVWYEVSGQTQKARAYYQRAAREGYGPAKERLSTL